jgi:hypothetical protein
MGHFYSINPAWNIYMFDLDAHQISFLHKTIRTDTGYSIESADSNVAVRIPTNLFTVDKEYEVTARRVLVSESPEREADLAAFEKSLAAPSRAPTDESGATTTTSPGGELSLGDVARRLRAEQAAQTPPQADTAASINATAVVAVPTGFKQVAFPSGGMTVLVPAQATEEGRTSDHINLRADLDDPKSAVTITLIEMNVDPARSPDDILDGIAERRQEGATVQLLRSEKKIINGMHAEVMELMLDVALAPRQATDAIVTSGGKGFSTSCDSDLTEFAKVESLCRTVVESIKAR